MPDQLHQPIVGLGCRSVARHESLADVDAHPAGPGASIAEVRVGGANASVPVATPVAIGAGGIAGQQPSKRG